MKLIKSTSETKSVSFRDEDYTEKIVSVNDIIYAGVPIDEYGNDLILKTEAIIFKP